MTAQHPQPTSSILSYYEALGMMMWLMKHADYHSQWPLWSVDNDIVPALLHGQTKLYFDGTQNPVGFVTWAWLDDAAREQVLRDEEPLELEQWNSGEHLLFVDFVAPWGHTRNILADLTTKVFPEHYAFSLGRNQDGSIRKVYSWKGIRYQGKIAPEQRTLNKRRLTAEDGSAQEFSEHAQARNRAR